jgi:plasmid stabilization system protein ParE
MHHAVQTLPRAKDDADRAISWLKQHVSYVAAARWEQRITKAIMSLSKDPDCHPEADEAADLGFPLRVLLSGRKPHVYRILFTINGQTVNVLRILHAARDRVEADDL